MKRFIFSIICIIIPFFGSQAQVISTISYDSNGNRILKKTTGSSTNPIISVSPANTVKYGQTVTLTATGCAGGTISWSTEQQGNTITLPIYGPSNTISATCKTSGCPNNGYGSATILGITGCSPGDVLVTAQAGNWNTVSTWACGRLPTLSDEVYINHPVTLDADGNAKLVVLGAGFIIQQSKGSIVVPQN